MWGSLIAPGFILSKKSAHILLNTSIFVQIKGDVGDKFQTILLEKVQFEPPVSNAFTALS